MTLEYSLVDAYKMMAEGVEELWNYLTYLKLRII